MENPVPALEALVDLKQGGQLRQDGTSNAAHVRRVRTILVSALRQTSETPAESAAIECGALGHDLLEDTDITAEELQKIVGKKALEYIREMTNTEGDAHTEQYVRQMVAASEEARLIKYADLIDNSFQASYQASALGLAWMQIFFLPIIDPMREALERTEFLRYSKTGSLLRKIAQIARDHLAESLKKLP